MPHLPKVRQIHTTAKERGYKMTLSKAKEIIKLYLMHSEQWSHFDLDIALALAYEALALLQHNRLIGSHHDPALLPGETDG